MCYNLKYNNEIDGSPYSYILSHSNIPINCLLSETYFLNEWIIFYDERTQQVHKIPRPPIQRIDDNNNSGSEFDPQSPVLYGSINRKTGKYIFNSIISESGISKLVIFHLFYVFSGSPIT